MENDIFSPRRTALLEGIPDASILLLFSGAAPVKSEDAAYPFAVSRNFYYLTGLGREQLVYLASKQGGHVQERLFIPRPDPDKEKWTGYQLREDEAQQISGIALVSFAEDFFAHVNRLLLHGDCKYAFFDFSVRNLDQPATLAQQFAQKLQLAHPYLQLGNVYPQVAAMRRIKSKAEIGSIKAAIAITADGLRQLWRHAQPGMKEHQLEAHFDFPLKMAGVKDVAFPTIVASGPNATVLHYVENNREIQGGELVLLDLGATFGFYCADISRTFPINGKFTPRQKELYELVLLAQAAVIEAVKPGFPLEQLNEVAKTVLAEGLLKLGMIRDAGEVGRYYYHRVSHFLGLDTHDVGVFEGELQAGMVITVEPGLYVAEENIGIRIEDDVLVTETGAEVLSAAIPKTVAELEAVLNSF